MSLEAVTTPVVDTPNPAPAAPAPATDAPKSIHDTIRELRESGAVSGPMEGASDALNNGEEAPHWETQPRDEHGRFAPSEGGEEEAAEPVEGEQAPTEDASPTEGGEEEGQGDEGEDEDHAPITVALPGRRPEDPPVEIEVSDPEVAERMRQLANSGMRRADYERAMGELQVERGEYAYIRHNLESDPAGFIVSHVRGDLRGAVVMELMADPQVYDAVIDHIATWDNDPSARAVAQANMRAERLERAEQSRRAVAEEQKVTQNAQEIIHSVASSIPAHLSGTDREQWYVGAVRYLQEYADYYDLRYLPPEHVPAVIEYYERTRQQARPPEPTSAPARATARPVGAPKPAPQTPAANAGEQFTRAREAKRRAATIAPAGAGPAPTTAIPKHESVKDRIRYMRENNRLRFS